jgi:biopolymer transport protein ExbD
VNIRKERRMKNLACIFISLIIAGKALAQAPALQRGIRVQMPITSSAGLLPDADNPDAWIVTITGTGDLYFGVDAVTPESLGQAMQSRPRNREQELYIKADSWAPSSSVKRVLAEARVVFFRRVFLLTATPAGAPPGKMVAPTGIPLWIAEPSMDVAIVLQISDDHGLPIVKIDSQQVSLKALQHKLEELLQGQNDLNRRMVLLKTDDVPFADLAHVVDACNMASARAAVSEN